MGDDRKRSKVSLRVLLPLCRSSPIVVFRGEGNAEEVRLELLAPGLVVVRPVPSDWSSGSGPVLAGDLYEGVYRAMTVIVEGVGPAPRFGAVGWLQFGWFDPADDHVYLESGTGQMVVVGVEYVWSPGAVVSKLEDSQVPVAGINQRLLAAFWPVRGSPGGLSLQSKFYY